MGIETRELLIKCKVQLHFLLQMIDLLKMLRISFMLPSSMSLINFLFRMRFVQNTSVLDVGKRLTNKYSMVDCFIIAAK